MGDKIINLLLDIVKYVFTIMLVYPLLSGMEKNWEYYTIVGILHHCRNSCRWRYSSSHPRKAYRQKTW
jgi:hypothetical protein